MLPNHNFTGVVFGVAGRVVRRICGDKEAGFREGGGQRTLLCVRNFARDVWPREGVDTRKGGFAFGKRREP